MNKNQKDHYTSLRIARTALVGCEYRGGTSHQTETKDGKVVGWNAVGKADDLKAASLASLIYIGRKACGFVTDSGDLWEDLRGIGGFPAKGSGGSSVSDWLGVPRTKVDILNILDEAMKAIEMAPQP